MGSVNLIPLCNVVMVESFQDYYDNEQTVRTIIPCMDRNTFNFSDQDLFHQYDNDFT